jgi:P27 family predicted phage terminase small subunit
LIAGATVPGPKPKATYLKLVTGNPGHRPLPKNEPKPQGNLSAPPRWFDAMRREYWSHYLANVPPGLLKSVDREMLVAYVNACATHRTAVERQLKLDKRRKHVLLARSKAGGYYQSPYVSMQNRQAEIMRALASELGFSPASRTRISINYGEGKGAPADQGQISLDYDL